ncbi:jg514 [Pararge aegeria aegeria]|uniref:Jg514 protein n=1 Tax=Pararge aegeria aegeria TaxID=348720 RepID=A0A8S4QLR5_9NEOP|nr:jg514 [Pararge aegeria aegeria]
MTEAMLDGVTNKLVVGHYRDWGRTDGPDLTFPFDLNQGQWLAVALDEPLVFVGHATSEICICAAFMVVTT